MTRQEVKKEIPVHREACNWGIKMVTLRRTILVLTVVLLFTFISFGQQLYFANEGKKKLQLLDFSDNQITTLYDTAGKPDDLILNSAGQLIYSIPDLGQVNLFDPVAGQNTTLVSGLKFARDLEIEPGGQTMLIAIYSPGNIVRFNFATGTTTVLLKNLGTCDGIKYDPYGNLYAVANHNTIIQIDPTTGVILDTLVLEPHQGINGGDGLTFDSYSTSLWTTHNGSTGLGLVQIPVTPSGLGSTFTYFNQTSQLNGVAPDGIKSDSQGNLYIGGIFKVFVYNIPSNEITDLVVTKGADGVSLVPGTY